MADGVSDGFYGFRMNPVNLQNIACPADQSLSGTTFHGLTVNDSATTSVDPQMPTLPNKNQGDGQPDFVIGDALNINKAVWSLNSNTVYSPLYNAVVFVYGNLGVNGNPSHTMAYSGGTTSVPGGHWRVSIMVFNNLDVQGTPAYAPATFSFPYLFAAGRDISLQGNAGGGGNFCPVSGGCDSPVGTAAGYEGIIEAHEQIYQTGSAGVDGMLVAEARATCSNAVSGPMSIQGNAKVHYDCDHPPDPWKNQSVRMQAWQEIQ